MKFFARSAIVLLLLYGMVFAFADAFLVYAHAPMWAAMIFVFAFVILQFALSPWVIEWIYSIDWDEQEIPSANREFVENLCRERGLPKLKLGIIHSDTPNAFSFGRFRADARVVITEGLLKILTTEEANAVLAHEVGHVEHYDFAIMTLAAAAPLVLYQMYVWGRNIKNVRAIAWGAYFAYLLGQFLVLTLNRTREYWADHYSATCTHEPGELASALVKIAYGMVKLDGTYRETLQSGTKEEKKDANRQRAFGSAIAMMGISNINSAQSLALGMANPEQAAAVMKWDLVNPWSRVYELSSTHPLTALRIRALNEDARQMHIPVEYPLPEDRSMRWGNFPLEFILWSAPFVPTAALFFEGAFYRVASRLGFVFPENFTAWMLIAAGALWAVRIAFRYHGKFEPRRIDDLLADLGVSQMRPRAVELHGEILGNGVPGAFWSPDLVMKDETGLMFLLYRSSIPLGRLFFAIKDADSFIGETITVKGWYRRGLRPYVEISEIYADVSEAKIKGSGLISILGQSTLDAAETIKTSVLRRRSYSRWIQLAVSGAVVVVGIVWLLN
jgi:Zn-dependent protease with chaperone function